MFIWVALKENAKQAKDIVDNYSDLVQSRMSAGRYRKVALFKKQNQTFHLGPMIWKVLQIKSTIAQSRKLHVLTTIKSKKKK